jgi:choloylglycine hydrolase
MDLRAWKLAVVTILVIGGLSIWCLPQGAEACTGIMLRNADGTIVHGRTVEFATPVELTMVVVPRGYEFTAKVPGGTGMKYKAKYGAMGTITFSDLAFADGINEKGLAIGVFYFPAYAKYAKVTDENRSKALSPLDFSNWILTQFATVAEARSAIESGQVVVAPTVLDGWGPEPPPFHYVAYDKTGASIVIEPVEGTLKVYHNPIGVMTNSPTFDWHMTNLSNYVSLQPLNVPPKEVDGAKLQAFGQGSGLFGIPGDFTPPSRFVRAAVFSATAIPAANPDLGIQQVFHILNNFDVPKGSSREKDRAGKVYADYTQWAVARDPQNLRLYFKSYDDQTVRRVDLKKFDLNAKDVKKINMKGSGVVIDISAEAK